MPETFPTGSEGRFSPARIRVIRTRDQGVARARNLGAAAAAGEFVVFIDAHCTVSPEWLDHLRAALGPPEVAIAGPAFTRLGQSWPVGCGLFWANASLDPVWFERPPTGAPVSVPLTSGACQAFRRSTFLALGRYDDGCTRWGFEDTEICLRAWLFGWKVVARPGVVVGHHFRESRGYSVDDGDISYNFVRMCTLHLSDARLGRVLGRWGGNRQLPAARLRAEGDGTLALRRAFAERRAHDDDWFFRSVNPVEV